MAKAQLVTLGRAIEERRKALGLSRTRLAQRFPVDPKTIERWEHGKNPGGFDNLDEVAVYLETTPAELQSRALEIARELSDESATSAGLAASDRHEQAAIARHAEVMTELGRLRRLLEAQETNGRQDGHSAANG